MRKFLILVFSWMIGVSPAMAECVDIIKASALKGTVVRGSSSIESEAKLFCSEYASAKSSGKSLSVSGSYGGLGLGVGSSSSKVDQVASKYCDSSDISKARSDNYAEYIESIAPGAFDSYNRCLTSNGNIVAQLPAAGVQPNDFTIIVINRSSVSAPQDVAYTASTGIECKWLVGSKNSSSRKVVLLASASTTLHCRRSDQGKAGSLVIVGQTMENGNYSFFWKPFQGGQPLDELQAIRQSNTQLAEALGSAIVAFNSDECPVGWKVAQYLAGRTIIGAGAGEGLSVRKRGEFGGTETHTLTVAEMPSHTHDYIFTTDWGTPRNTDKSEWEHGNRKPGEKTSPAGGDQPHNNMQPFHVLQYCQRDIVAQ